MGSFLKKIFILTALLVNGTSAWTSLSKSRPDKLRISASSTRTAVKLSHHGEDGSNLATFDPFQLSGKESASSDNRINLNPRAALVAGTTLLCSPAVASAATSANVIPSAFAAYGHFVSLMIISACIMAERVLIKPNMSEDEENQVAIADTVLGVAGFLLAYTGYIRVTDYGKGWEFYSHEPIFWLKITLVGVFGAASFFNTTKIIQRSVAIRNGNFEPMSEKLAARMIQICNAELVALASIPLAATLMARGVLYSDYIPWQAGAGVSALVFGGLSFKYIKEALQWTEDPKIVATESSIEATD